MKHECDQLRIKPLDQTNKEIMIDIRRSNVEIKELKKSLVALRDSQAEMTKEIQRMKTSQNDTVPWNIRGTVYTEIYYVDFLTIKN